MHVGGRGLEFVDREILPPFEGFASTDCSELLQKRDGLQGDMASTACETQDTPGVPEANLGRLCADLATMQPLAKMEAAGQGGLDARSGARRGPAEVQRCRLEALWPAPLECRRTRGVCAGGPTASR